MTKTTMSILHPTKLTARTFGRELGHVLHLSVPQGYGASCSSDFELKLFFDDTPAAHKEVKRLIRAINGDRIANDSERDITDIYSDHVGWDEDREMTVVALFSHEPCELDGDTPDDFTVPGVEARLSGIVIHEGDRDPVEFRRNQAIALLGRKVVEEIEEPETADLQGL